MANPGDKGQAELVGDTNGEVKVRIDGQYLAQALKACGGNSLSCFFEGYSPSSVGVSPLFFAQIWLGRREMELNNLDNCLATLLPLGIHKHLPLSSLHLTIPV